MKKRVFTKLMSMTLAAATALSFSGFIYADETEEGDPDDLVFEEVTIEEDEVPDVDLDSDELAEHYIMDKLAGEKKIIGYKFDYSNQLTGYDRELFEILLPYISKIASGELTCTKITIPQSEFAVSFSNEDLGIEDFTALSEDQLLLLAMKNNPVNFNKIINALMYACPNEMYWYDRPTGTKKSYNYDRTETEFILKDYTFSFYVARAYRDVDEFSVNKKFGDSLKSAADNVSSILNVYSSVPDYYKLLGYNNEICEMAAYDEEAAGTDLTNYGNPWQLVWVFDGDPETKAVCEGYAKAFQYLCDKTDFISDEIYTISVKGNLNKNNETPGGHEWNIVHMDDGLNYIVDTTNNDANQRQNAADGKYSILFLVSPDSGSVADSYKFAFNGSSTTLTYDYWDDTKSFYGDQVLTLAKKSAFADGYDPNYPRTLKISSSSGGGAEFAMAETWACAGDLINIWTYPDEGYEVDYITVNGKKISGESFYMPGRNVEVYVQFKKIDFKINVKYNEGGKVTAPATANYGDLVTLTVTPDIGYKYNNWFYLNGYAETGNSFTMPDYDVTVEVKFEKEKYYILAVPPQHGTMIVSSEWATYGEKVTVTTTPDTGYELDCIKVSGEVIDGNEFIMPAETVYVAVYYKIAEYSINTVSGIGGSASTLVTKAKYQDTVTVNAIPDTGYELDKIKVNNEVIDGNTFTMPAKDVTVEVSFKKINYNLTVNASAGGSAILSDTTATYGDTITVTATPDTGNKVDKILVNDEPIEGNTFKMPAANVTVKVTFKKVDYTITLNSGEGGTVTGVPSSANYLDKITVTASPATGCKLDKILVNNEPIEGNAFTMPAGNVTVKVTFVKIDYTVSVTAGEGGEAKVSKKTANYGDEITVTATPKLGYEVDEITVNGAPIEGDSFKMPARNVAVEVTFKKAVYTIRLSAGEGGSVELTKTTACYKDEITFDIKVDEYYHLGSVKINGVEIDDTVFEMPAGNVVVEVLFEKDKYDITVADAVNGRASVSASSYAWGYEVKVNVTPDKGYELDKLTYTPEGGEAVDITSSKKFTMPKAEVTVNATFKKEFVPTPTATATPTAAPKATATPTAAPKATVKPTKPTATPKATAKPTAASQVTLTLDKTSANVICGKTVALKATVKGSTAKVTWKSSNSKIAAVDASGKVTAKQAGAVTITASAAGKSADCKVQILFKDVTNSKDFWYEPTYYLVNKDVVKGYDNQTLFKPANECTRAQMLTFMWRLAGSPAPRSNKCSFPDVKSTDYFFKPVIWAVEKGITTGYSDGTFKPQNVCTRAQTVTFLWRMAGKPNPKSTANKFKDVKSSAYYYKATLWASEKKILAGYSDGTFRPDGLCLRRQMVTFLYKYDKFVNRKG